MDNYIFSLDNSDESDFDNNDLIVFKKSTPDEKRSNRSNKSMKPILTFYCKCTNCTYSTNDYYHFLSHLAEHVNERKECLDMNYNCPWMNCSYRCTNYINLKQHLDYHGYYLKLQLNGIKALKELKLPNCKEEQQLQIPVLPERFLCEWDSCDTQFVSYQQFLDHIRCHVNTMPKKNDYKNEIVQCCWSGCSNTFGTQYKLSEHMRVHTKEKIIACPTCGLMLSNRTKFGDHHKRQMSVKEQNYQCSQCSKLFANERLLRDHMRIHVNIYKCHLCDMTCPKPSGLAMHIRYRHLPERSFKCDICGHGTITYQDLMNHKDTHNNIDKMECLQCDFKCRSKYTLVLHVKRVHEDTWSKNYMCHCCGKKFARGALLSKHLIKVHDFHWPSGHSRFSYRRDPKTGLFQLQVVRYESLEVTQEMMQENVPFQVRNGESYNFKCEQSKSKSNAFNLTLIQSNK